MTTATLTRDPFMPQAPKVRGRALTLAVLAHLLLIAALAIGVNWRREEVTTVAAELWSATPQAAAPRAVEPEPTPPPPVPKRTEPVVKAVEPVKAPPPTPTLPDPQIAIEKAKREDARRAAAEQELKRQKLEKQKLDKQKAERDEAAREREELAQKKAAAEKADKARTEKADKAEAARLAALRDANLKRMAGLAGATGGPTDAGTALRSSAPSASYGGRVAARVKPNIVLTEAVDGNPVAVVEVRLAPDGTIVGKRLTQSSGSKAWDDAVLRAIERTEILPLDNGRAPPPFLISFRPRD